MIALIQRVTRASVLVEGVAVGAIGPGLLALLCAQRHDSEAEADALVGKMLGYRVFADAAGRMNLSVSEVGGGLLLVPQFTPAAAPDVGRQLFERCVARARARHAVVECGRFGAHMQVELINDGPVTFWLQVRPRQETKS